MGIALFRFLGALARNEVIASTGGSFFFLVLLLVGGFLLAKQDIPDWWIWAYWSVQQLCAWGAWHFWVVTVLSTPFVLLHVLITQLGFCKFTHNLSIHGASLSCSFSSYKLLGTRSVQCMLCMALTQQLCQSVQLTRGQQARQCILAAKDSYLHQIRPMLHAGLTQLHTSRLRWPSMSSTHPVGSACLWAPAMQAQSSWMQEASPKRVRFLLAALPCAA